MSEVNINYNELKKQGIIKVKNFLNQDELKVLKNILSNKLEKIIPKVIFQIILCFVFKILKLRIKDFKNHLYILKLARNKKLNNIADNYFKKEVILSLLILLFSNQ